MHPYLMSKKKANKSTVKPLQPGRRTGVDFSEWVAKSYLSKKHDAKQRGIEFSLTLVEFTNMLRAKRCQLTGIPLTHRLGSIQKSTDVTVDRKDSTKGYVKGNVHAVCYAANTFKGRFEDKGQPLTPKMMLKIAQYVVKREGELT